MNASEYAWGYEWAGYQDVMSMVNLCGDVNNTFRGIL